MIIDFKPKLINVITGEPLTDENKKELTLQSVTCNALFANIEDDKADGEEKLKRWELATRIIKNQKLELTVEEVTKIKEMIGKAYTAIVVGPAFQLLDPAVKEPKNEQGA